MDMLEQALKGSAPEVAQRLLGCELVRTIAGRQLRVKIVETEAYDQTDAASHSYKGRTPRTDVMFGPAGFLYVYFTYGMHYCCNIVTGLVGEGSAVLLRAAEPLEGESVMVGNRRGRSGLQISNGPAKLCQALYITKQLNGHDLHQAPLILELREPLSQALITTTTRIGVSEARDVPWRFYIIGSPYVSHD